MRLFYKVLFFALAIFSSNIGKAKVIVFDGVVSEIKFSVGDVQSKNESTVNSLFKLDIRYNNPTANTNTYENIYKNGNISQICTRSLAKLLKGMAINMTSSIDSPDPLMSRTIAQPIP